MIEQHVFGTDSNLVISANAPENDGRFCLLYRNQPRLIGNAFYPLLAHIEDFWLQWRMPSRGQITIDPAIYQALGALEARQKLKEDIYDSGLGFVSLQVIKSVRGVEVVLWEFPLFNNGLPSQSMSLLDILSKQDSAQMGSDSSIGVKLVNSGTGFLAGADRIDIAVTVRELVSLPVELPEIRTLNSSVSTLTGTVHMLVNSYNNTLTTLSNAVINQTTAIQGLVAAIEILRTSGGVSNTNTNNAVATPFTGTIKCPHPNNANWGKYTTVTPGTYKFQIFVPPEFVPGPNAVNPSKIIEIGAYAQEPTMANFQTPGNYKWLGDLPSTGGTFDVLMTVSNPHLSIKSRNNSGIYDTVFFSIDQQAGFSARLTLRAF